MTDSRELPGHSRDRGPRATSRLVHTGDPGTVALEVSDLAAETGGGLPDRDAWWVEATFDDATRSRFPTYPSAAEGSRAATPSVGRHS